MQLSLRLFILACWLPVLTAGLVWGQAPKRPLAYTLSAEAAMPQHISLLDRRDGATERVDLRAAAGQENPVAVHQVLLFDAQSGVAYAEDPVSHACFSAPYPSLNALANYDPLRMPGHASPAMVIPGAQLSGVGTVNGFPVKLYESHSKSMGMISTTKVWWSDAYDMPIKLETDIEKMPPMVMMQIKRLNVAAPAASFFVTPSGCRPAQGKWTQVGFELSGHKTVTLGAIAGKPAAVPPARARKALPDHYAIEEVNKSTEASLFTGYPATLKIYRRGSRERVDLRIAPTGSYPGFRERFLFDFASHQAYTTAWNGNVPSCSWISYVSADAPFGYDPIFGGGKSGLTLASWGKELMGLSVKDAGPRTINGMPATLYVGVGADGKIYDRLWWSAKYDLPLKIVMASPLAGQNGTIEEIKRLNFSTPPASLFSLPSGCSKTEGEWSDHGLNASASRAVKVAAPGSPR